MTESGCIGCEDQDWFKAYDFKEFEPQPDGSYKVTMYADGKQASRFIADMSEADTHDQALCHELGIKHIEDL